MGLLDDFERGINMFSPFALTSEKKLARQIGPALAGVMGDQVRANASVTGEGIRSQGMITATGMKESGDTFRQRLVNDAQVLLRDMMEKGQTTREGMSQSGANYRTDLQGKYATSLQKDKYRLDENVADNLMMMKTRALDRYNQIASPERTGSIVDQVEAQTTKKKTYSPSSFGSVLPFEDALDEYYSSGSY